MLFFLSFLLIHQFEHKKPFHIILNKFSLFCSEHLDPYSYISVNSVFYIPFQEAGTGASRKISVFFTGWTNRMERA